MTNLLPVAIAPDRAALTSTTRLLEKPWFNALWFTFATTLTRSLAWLGRRPIVTALVGAVALPLNYWAGQRLGAVAFPQTLALTLATMSVIWLFTPPLMYRASALLGRAEQGEKG
jgi:hypothetical protein